MVGTMDAYLRSLEEGWIKMYLKKPRKMDQLVHSMFQLCLFSESPSFVVPIPGKSPSLFLLLRIC